MSILSRKAPEQLAAATTSDRPSAARDGWDDPSSPFYIPEQLRPHYRAAEWDIERDTETAKHMALQMERVVQESAWKERNEPPDARLDLADTMLDTDGESTRRSFDAYYARHRFEIRQAATDRFERDPETWLARARHSRSLAAAAAAHTADIERRKNEEQRRRIQTCAICGDLRESTSDRRMYPRIGWNERTGGPWSMYRACDTCHAEVERQRAENARSGLSAEALERCKQIADEHPLRQ